MEKRKPDEFYKTRTVAAHYVREYRRQNKFSVEGAAMALGISDTKIREIESYKVDIDLWHFHDIYVALYGFDMNFYEALFETEDFIKHQKFLDMKRAHTANNLIEVKEIMEKDLDLKKIETEGPLYKKLTHQFIVYMEAKLLDLTACSHLKKIDLMKNALKMTISKYDDDKIKDYRLNYNELSILIDIANYHIYAMDYDKADKIVAPIYQKVKDGSLRPDTICYIPHICVTYSTILRHTQRSAKSLEVIEKGLEWCAKLDSYRLVPKLKYNLMFAYFYNGGMATFEDTSELAKEVAVQAYYGALCHNDIILAEQVRRHAKGVLGIEFGVDFTFSKEKYLESAKQ